MYRVASLPDQEAEETSRQLMLFLASFYPQHQLSQSISFLPLAIY
jgi:hypothetical protein